MKLNSLIFAFPLLCLACGNPDTDDANDAAGTASPYLAREVVGVHMLSNDTDYDKPCNVLGEEFVRATFNLGATTELVELDYPNGCTFEWDGNKVSLAFGGQKPYPSIYHAEYIFDKFYQGGAGQVSGQSGETGQKAPLSGPATQGIGAERPATEPEGPASADIDADSTAGNDSSNSISGVTSAATQFAKPVVSTARFMAVPSVGDKAVWEPSAGAMHVLYNNHIINVTVTTKDTPVVRQQRAQSLAVVLLDKVATGNFTR